MPFTLFYYVLSVVLFILALPLILLLSFKAKYRDSIPARFFLYKNSSFKENGGIWFHVCSLGEARALKPLVDSLTCSIKISTVTHTGYKQAKGYRADVRYLPYEMFIPFWSKKADVLVVLEAEFWYMLFLTMSKKGSKIVLLNARISNKSASKYLKMKWFYSKMLSKVDIIYAQSDIDKERFEKLGATNIEVIGNIKLAQNIEVTTNYDKLHVETIVAGSTHPTEEEAILKAYISYKRDNNSKLIVVPRHPERFSEVYELMNIYATQNSLTLSRFTEDKSFSTDLILVDAMGELNNIYAISDIAILGGAFRDDIGGHNPLEPANFTCKIISGKHFFHQKELFGAVSNIQIVEMNDIEKALSTCRDMEGSKVNQTIDLEPIIKKLKEQ